MYTTKSYLGFESRSLRNEGSRSRKWPAAMIFLRRKLACKAAGKSLRPDGLQGPSAAPSVARAPAASSEGMRSVSEHNPGRVGGHRLPHPLQGPLRRAVRECAASASTIPTGWGAIGCPIRCKASPQACLHGGCEHTDRPCSAFWSG